MKAPRVIKHPGLNNGQLAFLLIMVMLGIGLGYLVGVACVVVWHLLGWML